MVRALPPVDVIIALHTRYPSSMGPLFILNSNFYRNHKFGEFLTLNLNLKWSEEMPVLYEMAIYI